MEAQQSKLEFFHKLGYSKEEVCKVLDKLGQGASDNDLLQELVQMGSRPQEPKPVAQRACRTLPTFQMSTEEAEDPASDLRPIVIDGSNIAMRQAILCSIVFYFFYCIWLQARNYPHLMKYKLKL